MVKGIARSGIWPLIRRKKMETPVWMDWITGGLGVVIAIGGLFFLLSGVSAMNQADPAPKKGKERD